MYVYILYIHIYVYILYICIYIYVSMIFTSTNYKTNNKYVNNT